ncbi:tyrosine-type recombinase/integrase [Hoeflea prorocentri]|uniref:Site-specific integrase n=1 Tax=Hoeflea prorocentri TaxID=1922333 RepID=A0A9X3UEQ0_9HYPH|nr:site-specific integrase [Hoeflea prorocentri]MCY6379345.1 site-specific integrase [Hoeflea prorocentri]MDA5397146.1 site-specific integrase [Hoeflea prorocentri]
MARVRKRSWATKSGEKRTAWQLNYVDRDGNLQQKQFGTKREAEDERIRVEGQIARGVHVPDKRSITVGDAARAFLSDFENLVDASKRARITLRGYEQHVRLHLIPFNIAKSKISRLSGPDCVAFARELEVSRSDDLAQRVFSTLRMIVDYSVGQGWIGSNPARAISVRTAPDWEADRESLNLPPMEVLKTFLQASANFDKSGRAEAFVSVLLFQALRISELRAVSRRFICLKKPTTEIQVRRKADRWNNIERVKTKNSIRNVPIGPRTAKALRKWMLSCPSNQDALVFGNGVGKVESYANLYNRLWVPLMVSANIIKEGDKPLFGMHSLRHAGISLWIKNGATPKQVKTWAGHASIQTTWDIYGHLWREYQDERNAAKAAEQALFS